MDFDEYIRDFNRGDMRELAEKWYTEDVRFVSGRINAPTREDVIGMLLFLYDGVRARLRPQTVLRGEQHIFAEIDADHTALKDRLDYAFGSLLAGETATMKLFCLVKLRGDLICEFRVAEWPADIGVSAAPPAS